MKKFKLVLIEILLILIIFRNYIINNLNKFKSFNENEIFNITKSFKPL